MAQTRRLLPIWPVAVLLSVLSFGAPVSTGQKPPKSTIYPTVAEFLSGGIRNDGRGPYYDGVDGVSSHRVAGSGTSSGWAFDLKARRASEPRTLTYDLTNPVDGPPQGVITINDTHGQIYDLSNMAEGEVKYVRAAFHLIVNRVEYVLRFGQTPGDASSALEVTRVSSEVFHVRTSNQGDHARFLRGNGPGEILLGIYSVPVDLKLMNQ